jgi:hypothetical protein
LIFQNRRSVVVFCSRKIVDNSSAFATLENFG